MYGRLENSNGNLVGERVNIKLTIYYECTLTEFEDIGAFRMPFFDLHLDANKYTVETKN